MGLPFWAMQHFSDEIQSTRFEEERRQYCLPVLDPDIISCTEEPFDQARGRTNGSFVSYSHLDIVGETDADMYKIAIPVNASTEDLKFRIGDQGLGTMLVRMYPELIYSNMTLITAVDSVDPNADGANQAGYASLLYYLMYGVMPDESLKAPNEPFHFVAKCEFESIKYRDDYRSSWRKVDFTLRSGVSRAHVTHERCPNPRGNWTSGFDDLYFALEGAADILSSTDGYCKLFNRNRDNSEGADIFAGMSRLDAIVNKMLHITSTSWSESIYQYAMKNESVYNQPVIMTTFPHLYVIRVNWTPTTYIGLVLSLLITLNTYILAARWATATYGLGFDAETWNLLEPADLMAYSLAAYQDLVHKLRTAEQRQKVIRGHTDSILTERPVWEGTQSLIGLVDTFQSATSPTSPLSPVSISGEKTANSEDVATPEKEVVIASVVETQDRTRPENRAEGTSASRTDETVPVSEQADETGNSPKNDGEGQQA